MNANVAERFAELPHLLAGHLLLSVSAILVAVALSVPLGVAAARSKVWRGPALTLASLIQTVPALALLALMVPLLGGTIGFLPAFLALLLYGLLPTLRGTVTGIAGVDPDLIEAARGVGMTRRQRLFRVELPLALPVIVAGIRTTTVWVVGMATLSTPVGAPSLGNYIFAGLQTRNSVSVLFGCFFAALLAIVLDRLIGLAERAARERRRAPAWAAALGLLAVIAGGLAPGAAGMWRAGRALEPGPAGEAAIAGPAALPLKGRTIIVGAKPFTEQYVLAALISRHLEARGATVERLEGLGSAILFDALAANTVDLYVDYTGTLWTTVLKQGGHEARDAMFVRTAHGLLEKYGVLMLGRLGFENAYAFAMTGERAAELGVRSLGNLAAHAGDLVIGGDPEFFARPEWARVRDAYGLENAVTRGMDSTFMYGAVRDGEVDVIGAYTTDGRIDAFSLTLLDDPAQAFPPYDAVLLLSPRAAGDASLVAALKPLLNRIGDSTMRAANGRVDISGQSPEQAAAYLAGAISLP